jgi:Ca2+:H+ antiporter
VTHHQTTSSSIRDHAVDASSPNGLAILTAPRPAAADGSPTSPQASGSGSVIDQAETEKEAYKKKNIFIRFLLTTKKIILYSKLNLLLVFVPVGIIVQELHLNPGIIFAMNAIAIIPLAALLSHATESVARKLGDTIGALLNVTFGNAVELIIL